MLLKDLMMMLRFIRRMGHLVEELLAAGTLLLLLLLLLPRRLAKPGPASAPRPPDNPEHKNTPLFSGEHEP